MIFAVDGIGVTFTIKRVAAKTVDHIKAKAHGGTDDDSNLESLCWPCHRTKTGRERIK
ncbi:HNH endonuclease [Klebsiella pneumoniae]|uniref:HNH endonuclease n=1 Tax=Klebsiella pneumoniae TaxID=573 RepID=UPI003EE3BA88